MKHIKKFNKINEKMVVTPDLERYNDGEDRSDNIKKYFPDFYKENKERVDSGRIKFFYDPWATEVGCLIDLDSMETYLVDFR